MANSRKLVVTAFGGLELEAIFVARLITAAIASEVSNSESRLRG
jgi:hypothetical protein